MAPPLPRAAVVPAAAVSVAHAAASAGLDAAVAAADAAAAAAVAGAGLGLFFCAEGRLELLPLPCAHVRKAGLNKYDTCCKVIIDRL